MGEAVPSGEKGREWRSRDVIPGAWIADVASWSQSRPETACGLAWPVVLTPERVHAELALPHDAVLVFGETAWDRPLPIEQPLELAARALWVSVARGTTEIATETEAMLDGRVIARSLRVARTACRLVEWGERRLPFRPEPGDPGTQGLVVEAPLVKRLLGIVGVTSRLHDDAHFAQDLGHRTGLVPGLLFTICGLAEGPDVDAGQVRTWLRRPVEIGARVAVSEVRTAAGGRRRTFWASRDAAAIVNWNPVTRGPGCPAAKGVDDDRFH